MPSTLVEPFLSYKETINLVEEFLEAAIHTILYLRQVYPAQLFDKRKKYDSVLVWQSRHPALNEYIGRAIEAVGEELGKGSLRKVALVIKEASLDDTPLERFVFDFDWLVPEEHIREGGHWAPTTDGITRTRAIEGLRAFLLKLNAAESYLLPLPPPPGLTFGLVIELKDASDPPQSARARNGEVEAEWTAAEERHAPTRMGGPADMDVDDGDDDDRRSITPLKTTRLGIINVQMLVEELEGKFKLDEERRASAATPVLVDRKGKGRAEQW
ncbi:hypothetical protein RQP46_009742 [Phenoliferia psychrophenolica]